MKKVSLVLSVLLASNLVFAIGIVEPGKGGKETVVEGKESSQVKSLREALASAGISGFEGKGIDRLVKANPEEMTGLVAGVAKKLKESASQKGIAEIKNFSELARSIDENASKAADIRAELSLPNAVKLSPKGQELLQAMEAIVGVLSEVAAAGPKANMAKALDVSKALNEISVNDLKNDATSANKGKEVEEKLGVSLEDFIKRCLTLLKGRG